ncbi:MAG: amidohydrolase [Candidatus Omnitrophota bacterium]|nr:MAG: amidohydrolase [Candidatus Omnitrophota bacterium]
MSKIWDAHNHWMPPDVAEHTTFFKKGWSDIDLLLHSLDNARIEKAVLLYPTSDAHIKIGDWSKLCDVYNTQLAQKIKKHPDRLIGAGILPVDKPEEIPLELKRLKELGLSCISLASSYNGKYLDDEVFLPVFEQAEKENLPIFVHSQIINPIGFERIKDPLLMPVVEYLFDITMSVGKLMMSDRLTRFKDLKIVFAHFAGVLPFLTDRFDATYTMLRSRNIVKDLGSLPSEILKNIYVDTSGVKSPAMLNIALEFFGPDKILWGSDFPAKRDLSSSIKAVDSVGEKEKILGGNLRGLF